MKTLLLSLAIGTAITLGLFGLGYLASEQGAETLSYFLYWQAYLMQVLLPCSVVIAPGRFLCEDEAVGMTLFFAGLPVGILIYSSAACLVLRLLRRRGPVTPA